MRQHKVGACPPPDAQSGGRSLLTLGPKGAHVAEASLQIAPVLVLLTKKFVCSSLFQTTTGLWSGEL